MLKHVMVKKAVSQEKWGVELIFQFLHGIIIQWYLL